MHYEDIDNIIDMTVTAWLMGKDSSLEKHNEAEFSGSSAQDYSAFNDGGIECETGEFLFGLIRLIKPKLVLETGTHQGVGASYMAAGMLANGFGELHTLEFIPEHFMRAKLRIAEIGLDNFVVTSQMDVAKFTPEDKYDLILLDTEPQTRFKELLQFYPYLKEGGYLFIHDLHRHMHQIENKEHGFGWPYGKLPDKVTQLVKTGKLRPFHFETPRGLTGFYKVSKADYKW